MLYHIEQNSLLCTVFRLDTWILPTDTGLQRKQDDASGWPLTLGQFRRATCWRTFRQIWSSVTWNIGSVISSMNSIPICKVVNLSPHGMWVRPLVVLELQDLHVVEEEHLHCKCLLLGYQVRSSLFIMCTGYTWYAVQWHACLQVPYPRCHMIRLRGSKLRIM